MAAPHSVEEKLKYVKKLQPLEAAIVSIISISYQISRSDLLDYLDANVMSLKIKKRSYELELKTLVENRIIVRDEKSFLYKIARDIRREIFWGLNITEVSKLLTGAYVENYQSSFLTALHKKVANSFLNFFSSYYPDFSDIVVDLFDHPLDTIYLPKLGTAITNKIIQILYLNAHQGFKNLNPYIQFVEKELNSEYSKPIFEALYTLRGEISKLDGKDNLAVLGVKNIVQGNVEEALNNFTKFTTIFRKETGKKKIFALDISTPFYLFALLKQNDAKSNQTFQAIIKYALSVANNEYTIYHIFEIALHYRANNRMVAEQLFTRCKYSTLSWIKFLTWALVKQWFNSFNDKEIKELKNKLNTAIENDYMVLAVNLYEILDSLGSSDIKKFSLQIEKIKQEQGIESFVHWFKKEEDWELALNALALLGGNYAKAKRQSDKRLVWLVDFNTEIIQPKEQTLDKQGLWTEGRNVALKRLFANEVDSMTAQDMKIAGSIYKEGYSYYSSGESYEFNYSKAINEMVGHPFIFHYNQPAIGIELVKAKPELIIEKVDNKYQISFSEKIDGAGLKIIKETPTRYKLIEISEEILSMQSSMGKNKLVVPEKGKERLQSAIQAISSYLTIHSDMLEDTSIPSIQANSILHVHLLSFGDGFRIEFFVKPLTTSPPYFKPGAGGQVLYTQLNGKKIQAVRDLKHEEELAYQFKNQCSTLSSMEGITSSYVFEEPQDCLQFLTELEDVKDTVVVEWPEGEKMRIKHKFSLNNLKLTIQSSGNEWFEVEGEIRVSENKVMEMSQLLSLIEENKSNFIPLGNGDFISLTKEFRHRLEEMNAFANHAKGEFRFNAISAFALNDLFDNLDITADKQWKDAVKNIKSTLKLKPVIPANLEADLRPYQEDGYKWLFRLSHWGVGACLADDMGLGKTIQSIAILLERAAGGAALVVAPASVCNNWVKEIFRFAPSLNPVFFADEREILQNIHPSLVIITTYGLLQSNIEAFTTVNWHTIILDEAHAIKNIATKRAQAVMELNANFRLITTGTPIQNHLGELWSLFNFINPGLLGSLKAFNDRFAIPIEKNNDVIKRHQLKRLIQPFILRRTKNQVLEELPEKTEITINVELSADERAFYEALRRQAIAKIESSEGTLEQNRIQILSEITKLRRACCNPSLVTPEIELDSSKLSAFENIVDELIENKHRALVFSQFIGHLDIIRALLNKKGIRFQYLDGSTPLKDRETSINAFQAGAGDLFLISLKAGGLGLNLTAADYVIHLDPWWNPAVEDQASDRAHRIGQQKPVTIYKLITQNTIEEKIVKLHQNKRDLADSLLDGSDISAKVTASDLLKLIKN